MDTIKALMSRKSTRRFLDKPIPEEDLRTILAAGMSGPSCVNSRQWAFVAVTDPAKLAAMADGNGPAANPLRGAPLGILVCGDLGRAYKPAPDYFVIDGAIAAQNMILAAHALGIGSCWLGTWPQEGKMAAQRELFGLPEEIVPHSIIAFGYAASPDLAERDLYEESRVHREQW